MKESTKKGGLVPVAPGGLRYRKKQHRLKRIKESAKGLFLEKGYDLTTTRAIAKRADVGLATLYHYVEDKRDLLFLIFNDDHREITTTAFLDTSEPGSFLDKLVKVFGSYYSYFGEQPMLARYLLREMEFYVAGEQAQKIIAGRHNILEGLRRLVVWAREQGQIRSGEENAMIAQLIFDVYQAECRRWLMEDEPDTEQGLAVLRRAFRLLINGLAPPAPSTS